MRMILLFSAIAFLIQPTFADGPECTQASREAWMKSDEMKKKAENMGYKIKKFMTLEKCFEITGELNGKKVIHYFNPADGTQVQVPALDKK